MSELKRKRNPKKQTPTIPDEDCLAAQLLIADVEKERHGFTMTNLPEGHYHLADNMLAVAIPFKGVLKVHIRQYIVKEGGLYHPTIHGITMTVKTWDCFTQKITGYALNNVDASFIAHKELLVCVEEDGIQLQQLFCRKDRTYQARPCKVTLSFWGVAKLQESIESINKSICLHLFHQALPIAIAAEQLKRVYPHLSTGTAEDVRNHLMDVLKEHFSENLQTIFECQGCVTARCGQLSHDCITMDATTKYWNYGERTMTLFDMNCVAKDFCVRIHDDLSLVNKSFLDSLHLNQYKEAIEALYVKK